MRLLRGEQWRTAGARTSPALLPVSSLPSLADEEASILMAALASRVGRDVALEGVRVHDVLYYVVRYYLSLSSSAQSLFVSVLGRYLSLPFWTLIRAFEDGVDLAAPSEAAVLVLELLESRRPEVALAEGSFSRAVCGAYPSLGPAQVETLRVLWAESSGDVEVSHILEAAINV